MNIDMDHPNRVAPSAWEGVLRARGFVPQAGGFASGDLRFSMEARWLRFECVGLSAGVGVSGAPGLWTPAGNPGEERAVFDLPCAVLEDRDSEGQEKAARFDACLDWVLASSRGELPVGWVAPPESLLQSWHAGNALTLQQGPLLRQGELVLSPSRWAIQFPVASLPRELPHAREYFIGELLRDARRQWRMVRLDVATLEAQRSLLCEVDFSGAPHLEDLFSAGLEAARQAVLWLADSAELVADVSLALQSFELCCATANSTERKV